MVRCDDCGADVSDVWRHRERTESMTHHCVTWICRSCHPGVHGTVETASPDERVVVTDEAPVTAD